MGACDHEFSVRYVNIERERVPERMHKKQRLYEDSMSVPKGEYGTGDCIAEDKSMKSNKFKKIIFTIAIILFAPVILFLLAVVMQDIVSPLSRPEWAIKKYMLRKLPIGTDFEIARDYLSENWEKTIVNEEYGITISKVTGAILYADENSYEDEVVEIHGVKRIRIRQDYYFPHVYGMCVYFVFDEDDKLIEVHTDYIGGWP